jgi:DNA (cytosine-5)-methyltransferase 1
MLNHASLFSGIGGFDLAAQWVGWENLFHCEWNPFGQKVLKHYFPNSISYNDITKTDFTIHRGQVDILSGGFPCQPYSTAGKRLGKEDERHLWPEMLRTIREVKPSWVVGENVRGLINWNEGLVFHEVQSDLEAEGYEVQPFLIPAAGVNAPHQRYRIWFVAYSNNKKTNSRFRQIQSKNGEVSEWHNNAESSNSIISGFITNSKSIGQEQTLENKELERGRFRFSNKRNIWDTFPSKPALCGGNDGLPKELDGITFPKWRNESIKAYGNAIVPQVAFNIFKSINEYEKLIK